jgi:hypothetical protein
MVRGRRVTKNRKVRAKYSTFYCEQDELRVVRSSYVIDADTIQDARNLLSNHPNKYIMKDDLVLGRVIRIIDDYDTEPNVFYEIKHNKEKK